MTEKNQVWLVTKRYITPFGHFTRIESSTELGIPDLAYTVQGHSGWIENKLFDRGENKCPSHLTREQVMWAEEETRAGGTWHLFGRCGPVWLLYDVVGARALLDGGLPLPIFRMTGRFPLKELLHVIQKKGLVL